MQRALFLIEATGERISALLNPEQLVLTRRSGIETLRYGAGAVTGTALSDDVLLATGGGSTELVLDLLFDVDLSETTPPSSADTAQQVANGEALPAPPLSDVRELTRPLWNLSEGAATRERRAHLPIVRFIWGRSWNLPGVVTDVAERFERFDAEGRPRRSFLRLKLRRVAEPDVPPAQDFTAEPQPSAVTPFYEFPTPDQAGGIDAAQRIDMPVDEFGMPSTQFYQLAAISPGDPTLWRLIASFNKVDNPFRLEPDTLIALPPVSGGLG